MNPAPSTLLVRNDRHHPRADRIGAIAVEAVIPETEVVAGIPETEIVAVNLETEVVAENPEKAMVPESHVTAASAVNRVIAVHVTETGEAIIVLRILVHPIRTLVVHIPDPKVVRVVTANGADIPIAMENVPGVTNIIGR